jgi:flagellar hook-associated protein 3 FlgL
MRITNLMIQKNLMSGLRGRMTAIAKASSEATTGHRVNTVSDDPVDASQIMRMQAQINDIQQYTRNGTFATTKLSVEDTAISSLRDTLTKAKNLAMATTAANPSDPARVAALAEAQTLKEQLVSLGNTRVGDQYIFGGDNSTTPPFQSNGTYVGDTGTQQVEITSGVKVSLTHAGQPLFTDAIASINNLITQLQTGTPAQVGASVSNVESAMQTALQTQAEVGSRMQDVKNAGTQLAAQSSAILDRRDALMNVDPASAIVSLQQEQGALERAYAVIGRVMQASLTDYLK